MWTNACGINTITIDRLFSNSSQRTLYIRTKYIIYSRILYIMVKFYIYMCRINICFIHNRFHSYTYNINIYIHKGILVVGMYKLIPLRINKTI